MIIYEHNKTNENEIKHYINNIHPELKFTMTEEENNTINFLDLTIIRKHKNWKLIYTKNLQLQIPQYTTNQTTQ